MGYSIPLSAYHPYTITFPCNKLCMGMLISMSYLGLSIFQCCIAASNRPHQVSLMPHFVRTSCNVITIFYTIGMCGRERDKKRWRWNFSLYNEPDQNQKKNTHKFFVSYAHINLKCQISGLTPKGEAVHCFGWCLKKDILKRFPDLSANFIELGKDINKIFRLCVKN